MLVRAAFIYLTFHLACLQQCITDTEGRQPWLVADCWATSDSTVNILSACQLVKRIPKFNMYCRSTGSVWLLQQTSNGHSRNLREISRGCCLAIYCPANSAPLFCWPTDCIKGMCPELSQRTDGSLINMDKMQYFKLFANLLDAFFGKGKDFLKSPQRCTQCILRENRWMQICYKFAG